jgi:hypothetical protein
MERYEVICGITNNEDDIDIYGSMRIPGILVETSSESDWLNVDRRIKLILDLENAVKSMRKL